MYRRDQKARAARPVVGLAAVAVVVAVAAGILVGSQLRARPPQPHSVDAQGAAFVNLALALAQPPHASEVDAYFGPPSPEGRSPAAQAASISELQRRASALLAELQSDQLRSPSHRRAQLETRTRHFIALLEIIAAPGSKSFDEEADAVYGMQVEAVHRPDAQRIAERLSALLPGAGSLAQCVAAFQQRFVVTEARRKAVFERALAECRTITLAHWQLPPGETLSVEWTPAVDSAWLRYHGRAHSSLQLNPQAVAFIGSAIDVACHEGYPGHHAQFSAMEMDAGAAGLAVEDRVVLLRSPESALHEGAANYGVDLAFPPEALLTFERDTLFPLADFDPAEAPRYLEVHCLINELALSVLPILRDYRDGRLSFDLAAHALETEALVSSPQALLRFVDGLGAYAIGYTAVRDAVRDEVAAQSLGSGKDRWTALRGLLARPGMAALAQPTAVTQEKTADAAPACSASAAGALH